VSVLTRIRQRLFARVFLHGVALVVVSLVSIVVVVLAMVAPALDKNAAALGVGMAPHVCTALAHGARGQAGIPPATLFDASGNVVASTAAPPFVPLTASERLEMQRNGVVRMRGRAVAAAPCDAIGAYVVMGHPDDLVPLLPLAVATLVILAIVSLGSIPLARSVVAPVKALVGAAKRIGSGDLALRVATDRNDELGDLARAFDDMTERLGALVAAEKELLANVSHELRTPLSRIRVVLETAEESPARAQALLGQIGVDLADLERLVEDVMDAMRLDVSASALGRAELPLRREQISLEALVAAAIEGQRMTHSNRAFELHSDGDDFTVEADPRLLRRVVDNVLQNAVKYSNADAPIVVRIAKSSAAVELTIVDQGIGIDQVDLPNVFRPFFRGDRSRTRNSGGAGLGLALSKRICDVHGGTIEAESQLGAGTTIRVRLPLHRPARSQPSTS
jgi:two-component system OmpR family sensor kinase